MTLAIIPARGGSKGIQHKNLTVCARKPLLQWTLDAVKDASLVSEAVLSSDDQLILDLASNDPFGFRLDRRPSILAQDDTPTEDVIAHVLETVSDASIVLLQPTSPIRTGAQIDEAIRLLQSTGADSVVSVVPTHELAWEQGVWFAPLYTPTKRRRRQDMGERYAENGSIYVFTLHSWEQNRCRIGTYTEPYIMDQASSIQVDTPFDLWMAEQVLMR